MPLSVIDYPYFMRDKPITKDEIEAMKVLQDQILEMIPPDLEIVWTVRAPEPVRVPGDWIENLPGMEWLRSQLVEGDPTPTPDDGVP